MCPSQKTDAQLPALGLDFTTLVSNLDNTASEIVAFQRDSTVQRKDLAQKTKDFRKLDDASKLAEIKGLLKGKAPRWCWTADAFREKRWGPH